VHERLAPLTVALVAIPITFMVTRYLLVDAWQGTYGIGGEREAHEAGNANRLEAPSGSTE
jgi:hypothetical protein